MRSRERRKEGDVCIEKKRKKGRMYVRNKKMGRGQVKAEEIYKPGRNRIS